MKMGQGTAGASTSHRGYKVRVVPSPFADSSRIRLTEQALPLSHIGVYTLYIYL